MGKVTGFKEFSREVEPYRPAKSRVLDFKEIYTDHDDKLLNTQAARCMNCGVPFCQSGEGCPVYNLIPEWNDLVYNEQWEDAFDRLFKTNWRYTARPIQGGSDITSNALNQLILNWDAPRAW